MHQQSCIQLWQMQTTKLLETQEVSHLLWGCRTLCTKDTEVDSQFRHEIFLLSCCLVTRGSHSLDLHQTTTISTQRSWSKTWCASPVWDIFHKIMTRGVRVWWLTSQELADWSSPKRYLLSCLSWKQDTHNSYTYREFIESERLAIFYKYEAHVKFRTTRWQTHVLNAYSLSWNSESQPQ